MTSQCSTISLRNTPQFQIRMGGYTKFFFFSKKKFFYFFSKNQNVGLYHQEWCLRKFWNVCRFFKIKLRNPPFPYGTPCSCTCVKPKMFFAQIFLYFFRSLILFLKTWNLNTYRDLLGKFLHIFIRSGPITLCFEIMHRPFERGRCVYDICPTDADVAPSCGRLFYKWWFSTFVRAGFYELFEYRKFVMIF